jgi:hypothetical protein
MKGKRALAAEENEAASSSKRFKHSPVYVAMGYTESTSHPLDIAQYVARTIGSQGMYIEDATWCYGYQGWIRIKFTDLESATGFVHALSNADPRLGLGALTAYFIED